MKTDRSVVPNRPRTELNEDEKKEVLKVLSQGLTKRDAARTVGCHVSTINSAIARDPEFALATQQSQVDPMVYHLALIQEAGKKSWRASVWFLEHLYPERFVKRKPDHLTIEEAKDQMEDIMRHMMQFVPQDRRAEVRQKFRQLREDWANGVETPLEEAEEEQVFEEEDAVELRDKVAAGAKEEQVPERHGASRRCGETAEMTNDEARMTKEEQVPERHGASRRCSETAEMTNDEARVTEEEQVPERHGASRRSVAAESWPDPPAASAVPLTGTTRGREAPALRTGAGAGAGAVQTAGKAGAMPPRVAVSGTALAAGVVSEADELLEDFLPLEPWPGFVQGAPMPEKKEDFNPAPWEGYYAGRQPPADWSKEQVRAAKRAVRAAAKPYQRE